MPLPRSRVPSSPLLTGLPRNRELRSYVSLVWNRHSERASGPRDQIRLSFPNRLVLRILSWQPVVALQEIVPCCQECQIPDSQILAPLALSKITRAFR